MAAKETAQVGGAVASQDHPELHGAEPPAEGDLPILVVHHLFRLRRLVAEIFGTSRQRRHQRRRLLHPHAAAVQVGEEPLVGIKAEGFGILYAVNIVAELWADGGGAAVGRVYVHPHVTLTCDFAEFRNRIHGGRRGGSHGGAKEDRHQPEIQVFSHCDS